MDYKFPAIFNIAQILRELKDIKYNIVNEDYFCVINCESTNSPILREIRGLVFGLDGKIIARPYHHAFCIDENEETKLTKLRKVKFKELHVVLEKLDGTTIYPAPTPYGYRLIGKTGICNASMNAEIFVASRREYNEFIKICLSRKLTPIFEWCSPKNKIVIDYPEDNLILTGLRNIKTGVYCQYNYLRSLAINLHVPFASKEQLKFSDLNEFIDIVSSNEEKEGVVVKFDSGHMLYVKSNNYLKKRD
jgi:RNA ligase